MQLTKSQKQAVEYNKGPLLLIAGAGTGKTTVLVEKIKYLIKNNLAKPEEILALTFTEKAAFEMEERVDKALPYGYFQMFISTFHSFCDKILRQEASHIGLSLDYALYSSAELILYFKKNFFQFDLKYFLPLGNPHKFIESLLQHFSRLGDEDISPKQYVEWIKVPPSSRLSSGLRRASKSFLNEDKIEIEKNLELAKAYKKFQQLKIKDGVMDFADLIFYTLKLFRQRNNLLKKYRKQFKYILVDEFQDTNLAQYELIKLIAPAKDNPNLTIVGDDSQSIYKFRGAAVSNILNFKDDYQNAQKILLTDNFRSNQRILDCAYQLIKNNNPDTLEYKLNISKNLKSIKGEGDKKSVEFHLFEQGEKEAEFTAREILKLKKEFSYADKKYQWSDFALLVRANNHADYFIQAFQNLNIPYQFLGQSQLFKQKEVKELIAYLRVLGDLNDSPSLYRVLTMAVFNFDEVDLARLNSFAKRTNLSLFESIEVYLSFSYQELSRPEYQIYKNYLFITAKETKEKLFKIFSIIKKSLALLKKESVGQVLFYFLQESGYLNKLTTYQSEKEEKIALNISKFFEKLKSLEMKQKETTIFNVIDYLQMSLELGESPLSSEVDKTEYDAVNILTAHSAKGLEFSVVFLTNLINDRFPTRERSEVLPLPDELIKEILPEGNYHLQEERRLFYVALTRAKDKVYLTASQFYNEGKRERKISPFVYETIGEKIVFQEKDKKQTDKLQLSIFDFKRINEITALPKKALVNNFSFSQFDAYTFCPLRYKYQYILKIPTTASHSLSFGQTMHQVLQNFYQLFKLGGNPNLKALLGLYQKSWIPIGYTSKKHQEKMKKEGEKILKDFYHKYHNDKLRIFDLEKWFKIKIDNDIFVSGKIDRIDLLDKNRIEIIDYKTGKKPEEKNLKKNLQMGIYALSASSLRIYNKSVSQIVLTFYFLQDNSKVSLQKNSDELLEVKDRIKELVFEINQSDFKPKAGPWCKFCSFKINCEAW